MKFGTADLIKKLAISPCLWLLYLATLMASFSLPVAGQSRDYTRWVNPFIGTGGHGHTFPGATLPFGMVQLSPDTRIDNWDGSSGYHYSDDIIYGFSHTHLSGTGIPDGCDILFMPSIGEPQFFAKEGDKSVNGYASKFSHLNEKAEPGYYRVKLDDDGIGAELSSTQRVGIHRYTFPRSDNAHVILDMKWRDKLLAGDVKVAGKRIEGFRRSASWAKNQTVYFAAEFSKAPIEVTRGPFGIGRADEKVDASKLKPTHFAFRFKTRRNEQIVLKVAISYVSIDGARKNLAAELPHWNFDTVRTAAKAVWNKELGKIEVSGGTPEQTTNFYTALYHTMIHPNVFNDVDGRYKGHDGKVHQLPGFAAQPPYLRRSSASPASTPNSSGGSAAASGRWQSRETPGRQQWKSRAFPQIDGQSPGEHYTVFSLWDTFRAAHPLYTIIDQKRTVDFINSFIRMYEQGGRLPVWEVWGEETDTMIGYHAVSVIADAMAKGIKGFDYEKAYAAAKHSAELDHHGLAGYKKRGYVSSEDDNESVSKTLEYAYNDWCIGYMLYLMHYQGSKDPPPGEKGKQIRKDFEVFTRRALNYQNLFDPTTGFFRPKRNGGFVTPFAPNEVTFHFTEGNSWQYSFFVPHNIQALMTFMGGREKFVEKLDELFTTEQKLAGRFQPDITGLIGQYAHGNEPSHHIPYLYNYAGQPWKTQQYVRKIMDEFYKNAPDGLIGNEDCGQMSAWYVMSASGFYPVAPGRSMYEMGTPLFPEVKYNLENGKVFTVRAPNVSAANKYIRSASFGGKRLVSPHIAHSWMMTGGTLELEMSAVPEKQAFTRSPVSLVADDYAPVPVIQATELIFRNSTTVSMSAMPPRRQSKVTIHYTTDGTEPTERSPIYAEPFEVDRTTTVKAISIPAASVMSNFYRSHTVEATFHKRRNDWTVKLLTQYSSQYPGGGHEAVIDGLRGNNNFAAGEWQGYQGKPFEAVIDLGKKTIVKEVGGSFLQNVGSWIWLPDRIIFEVSDDGVNFKKVTERKNTHPVDDMKPRIQEYSLGITPVYTRYVRVRAENFGKIPDWHPGAGGDPWIFVDEIFIRGDPFGNPD